MLKFDESHLHGEDLRLGDCDAGLDISYDTDSSGVWDSYVNLYVELAHGIYKQVAGKHLGTFDIGDVEGLLESGNAAIPEVLRSGANFLRTQYTPVINFIADYERKNADVSPPTPTKSDKTMNVNKRIEQRALEIAENSRQQILDMVKAIFGVDVEHHGTAQHKGDNCSAQQLGDDGVFQQKSQEDETHNSLTALYDEITEFRNRVRDVPDCFDGLGYARDIVSKSKELLVRLGEYPNCSRAVKESLYLPNLNSGNEVAVEVTSGGLFLPSFRNVPGVLPQYLATQYIKVANAAIAEDSEFYQEQALDYAGETISTIREHEKNSAAVDMLTSVVNGACQDVYSFIQSKKETVKRGYSEHSTLEDGDVSHTIYGSTIKLL